MTLTLPRAPRRAATAVIAGLALVPLAGCGGDDASSSTGTSGKDLARFAPAAAPFYAEATIKPSGELKTNLDGLVQKFAPGKSIDGLVSQAIAMSSDKGKVDFEKDVKPWLGDHAGLAVTGVTAGSTDPDVVAFVETTDGDKALDTLRKTASGKVEDRQYNGTKYIYDAGEKDAAAIVDNTLVVGTEAAFKSAIDTQKSGKGLDTNAAYKKSIDEVDEDAVGSFYGDLGQILDLASSSGAAGTDAKQLDTFKSLLEKRGVSTFAGGLAATASGAKFRVATTSTKDGAAQSDAAASTLADLPAGSFAAFGLGDLGKSISQGLDSLKGVSGAGFDLQGGLDQLKQSAGIDIQKDLLSWMGNAGLSVSGSSLTDIGGALVVQSKDPSATKAALAKARTLVAGGGLQAADLSGSGIDDGFSVTIPNAPIQVFAALAGDKFVLAASRGALDQAVKPSTKLSDDASFKTAADTLGDGEKPTFFLDFPKISGLVALAASGQPDFAKVKPYLDKITTIVAGSKVENGMQVGTLAVGVK